jgi:hypothetical protein
MLPPASAASGDSERYLQLFIAGKVRLCVCVCTVRVPTHPHTIAPPPHPPPHLACFPSAPLRVRAALAVRTYGLGQYQLSWGAPPHGCTVCACVPLCLCACMYGCVCGCARVCAHVCAGVGTDQAMWKHLQFWEFYFVRVLALQPDLRGTSAATGPGPGGRGSAAARRPPAPASDDPEETVFQLVGRPCLVRLQLQGAEGG